MNDEESNLQYIPHLIGDKKYLTHNFYSSFFTDKYITEATENAYIFTDKTPISAGNISFCALWQLGVLSQKPA